MKVIFTQNCTMSVGNMTVKKFVEGEEAELDGVALNNALADGRCVPAPENPVEENKMAAPVLEVAAHKTPSKKKGK